MASRSGRDIVVVAASAGGLIPLRRLLAGLPAELPASVLTVLHIPATGGQALPRILDRSGLLPAAVATDGEKLAPGRVYVPPPDRHVLIVNGAIRLSRGPRQNGVRPAADPLFRSAALYGGPRTVAVVLSGTLDDAALGCATVERQGGLVVVQDPAEAAYPGMPTSTLAATRHAVTTSVAELPGLITRLVTAETGLPAGDDPAEDLEAEIDRLLNGGLEHLEHKVFDRTYTGFTCPDCGGPLYIGNDGDALTYDCVVGHTWSPQSLVEEQSVAVERAVWLAIRTLDERSRLTRRLASQAAARGQKFSAGRFREAAREAAEAAEQMRKVADGLTTSGSELDDPAGRGDTTPIE